MLAKDWEAMRAPIYFLRVIFESCDLERRPGVYAFGTQWFQSAPEDLRKEISELNVKLRSIPLS